MALDTLEIFGDEFTGVTGIKATDDNNQIKTYIRPQGTKSIITNGTGIDVTNYASVDVSVPSGGGTYQTKTISPTTSQQTVTPDSGYDALSSVTVNAMPSGTAGTPTATKGTVSNHSVSVTPSVTNTTGYITGSTKTGTAVTVSASELVSGTKSISANGTGVDVTNYALVDVSVDDSTFVITMSWDSSYGSTGAWVPNKTWAQISAAATAGKTIVAEIDSSGSSADSSQIDDDSRWITQYGTYEYTITSDYGNQIEYMKYTLISTDDVTLDDYYVTYNTSDATATASDVANGKVFYGTNGQEIGTASGGTYQTKTVSPSTSQQTVTPDSGYDALSSVTVNAMPAGTAGTPTATKGTVSNHSVSVTPSVTNTTGYITGSTKTGTAVTVSASELVSGTKSIITNGTGIDVANYALVNVSVDDSTFIVTLSYNSQTEMWEPDCTYEEIATAYNSGKEIVATTNTWQSAGIDFTNLPRYVSLYVYYYDTNDNHYYYDNYDLYSDGEYDYGNHALMIEPYFQTVNKTYTPTTSTQTETVTFDTSQHYNGLQAVNVTVNAMPTGTATAPTSISGTTATVSTGTNTLTLTKTVSVTPNVTTAGYISAGTAGNASVSLTASVTTKAAATITPGTTNQTIASGTYLTGTQTIAGDADLVASNIVNGVQIFGVTGNVVLQNYYTGSTAPSSSLGSNGDLYLQN